MRGLLLLYTERGKVRSSNGNKDEIASASALIAQQGSDQDCFVHLRVINTRLQQCECMARHLLSGVSK